MTKKFTFYDPISKVESGYPEWMGGVVTQVPIAEQPVRLEDVAGETQKQYAVNSSGFRVECFPDPNSEDKDLSKLYTYVPMHHIRPLAFWKEILAGIPEQKWHPTIKNCFTAMATFSLIERYRFKGTWPNANIYGKGCFLGAEAIFVGDTVRLVPKGKGIVTDILHVTDIALKLIDIHPDHPDHLAGHSASHVELVFHGHAFTRDITRSQAQELADLGPEPHAITSLMHAHGPWYHLARPGDLLSLDHSAILSRLYDLPAIRQWLPHDSPLSAGRLGLLVTKRLAPQLDARLRQTGAPIYVADSRAEALNLATFNGVNVGPHDRERDPKAWRHVLTILDGMGDGGGPAKKRNGGSGGLRGGSSSRARNVEIIISDDDNDAAVDDTIDELITGVGLGSNDGVPSPAPTPASANQEADLRSPQRKRPRHSLGT